MTQQNPNSPASQPASADERPHKPADDREEVYFHGSPMLRGAMGQLILCTLISLGLLAIPIALAIYDKNPPILVWLIAIVLATLVILIPTLMAKRVRYRISNYRVDFERGLLSKTIDTLELW